MQKKVFILSFLILPFVLIEKLPYQKPDQMWQKHAIRQFSEVKMSDLRRFEFWRNQGWSSWLMIDVDHRIFFFKWEPLHDFRASLICKKSPNSNWISKEILIFSAGSNSEWIFWIIYKAEYFRVLVSTFECFRFRVV